MDMNQSLKHIGVAALALTLIATPVLAFANSGKNKAYAPRSVGSTLEVAIRDDGSTVVRGARVTNVSGGTITAQTIWDASSITWTVRTDGDTDFYKKSGSASVIGDISTGDYVSFSGSLTTGSSFTVDADVVKNWSLLEDRRTVAGTVSHIDGSELTINTKADGAVTVRTNGDTSYQGRADALADITVGSKIVVSGPFNTDTKVLTATSLSLGAELEKEKHNNGKGWGTWIHQFRDLFRGNR